METPKRIRERRRALRLDCELPFRLGHEGYEAEVVSVNLSATGAYFRVSQDIPMMSKLNIGLALPKQKSILHIKGVVVRKEIDKNSGDFFIAVYFSEIKPLGRSKLKKFIQSRAKS